MFTRPALSTFVAAIVLAGAGPRIAAPSRAAWQAGPAESSQTSEDSSQTRAPSEAEIRIRAQRLIENQHRDDNAVEEYERIEHHLDRTAGANSRTIEDKVYRVVPTGTGTLKILLKDNGTPTDPAEYRRQLEAWEQVLELMLKTNDSRAKTAYEKYDKRKHDRTEMVDGAGDAFVGKWLGRETLFGHDCDVIELEPNPAFHPRSILQEALTHVTAKAWVEHSSDQLVRGEAQITRDISFGAGILGKLYHGGSFSMNQAEMAPGIWLPTRYQYDFVGRKFLFSFEEHQTVELSHYRKIGPPNEALSLVQAELANGKTMTADP